MLSYKGITLEFLENSVVRAHLNNVFLKIIDFRC